MEGYTVPPLRIQSDDFKTYATKQKNIQTKSDKKKPLDIVLLELKPTWTYGNVKKPAKKSKGKDLNIKCKPQANERDGQAGGIVFDISKLDGKKIQYATHIRIHLKAKKTDAGGYVSLEIHDDDNGDKKTTCPFEEYYPKDAGIDNRYKYHSIDDIWTAHKIKVNPGDDFVIYVPISAFLFNKGGGDNTLNLYHNDVSEITRISLNINALEDEGPTTPLNIINTNPTDVFMLAGLAKATVPQAITSIAKAQDPLYGKDNTSGGEIKYKQKVGLSLVDAEIDLVSLPDGSSSTSVIILEQ